MLSLTIVSLVIFAINSLSETAACPQITTQKDFDVSRYLGLWYEAYRNNIIFEIGSKCVNATYTANADGTAGVWNQAIDIFGTYSTIRGTAKANNSSEPGALEVKFDNGNTGSYNVLATDYDTYSLVYSCKTVPVIGQWEFVWFLSRSKTLAPEVVEKLKSILSDYRISFKSLTATSQDCSF